MIFLVWNSKSNRLLVKGFPRLPQKFDEVSQFYQWSPLLRNLFFSSLQQANNSSKRECWLIRKPDLNFFFLLTWQKKRFLIKEVKKQIKWTISSNFSGLLRKSELRVAFNFNRPHFKVNIVKQKHMALKTALLCLNL